MGEYSRSIEVPEVSLKAGDLVRLFEVVQAKAFASNASIGNPKVSLSETLPDGASVSHPRGGLSLLQDVCIIDKGTEISVAWYDKEMRPALYIGIKKLVFGGVSIFVSTPKPGMLNDTLGIFAHVFDPADHPEDRIPPSRGATNVPVETASLSTGPTTYLKERKPETNLELKKVHIDGVYKILAAVVAGGLAIIWWKLSH